MTSGPGTRVMEEFEVNDAIEKFDKNMHLAKKVTAKIRIKSSIARGELPPKIDGRCLAACTYHSSS